jgi:hypothetical protein
MPPREPADIIITDVLAEPRPQRRLSAKLAFHDLARDMANKPNEIFPQS